MTLSVREADPGEWDSLLDRCERATVYHRDGWLHAVETTCAVRVRRLVCESGGRPLCAWPLGLIRKGPLRVGGSPLPGWNTAYLGPVFTPECDDRLGTFRAMVRGAPVSSPSFLAVRLMDTDLDLTPLGFIKTREFETYVLDLARDEKALWDAMEGRARTAVRKCEKSGVTFREEIDASYVDDLMRMTRDVFARSGLTPPYSAAFLEALEERLRPAGRILVGSAMVEGQRAATIVIPHDGRTGVYFAGATAGEHLKLSPSNLAMWQTIRLCQRDGLGAMDMISTRGSPGRFKQSFGPEARISCVHWEHTRSAFVRALRKAYERRARGARKAPGGSPA